MDEFHDEENIDTPADMLSSRSSKKDLAILHDSLQKSMKEDEIQKQYSERKQFKILSQSEISKLSELEK